MKDLFLSWSACSSLFCLHSLDIRGLIFSGFFFGGGWE